MFGVRDLLGGSSRAVILSDAPEVASQGGAIVGKCEGNRMCHGSLRRYEPDQVQRVCSQAGHVSDVAGHPG